MSQSKKKSDAQIESVDGCLVMTGHWTLHNIHSIRSVFLRMKQDNLEVSKLDATAISRLDSAGALFLQRLISYFESGGRAVELVGLQPRYRQLVDFIRQEGNKISVEKRVFVLPNWFYQIGSAVAAHWDRSRTFFAFIGELVVSFFYLLAHIRLFDFKQCANLLFDVLSRSFILVCVTNFLMGVVLSYQLVVELSAFGAGYFAIKAGGVAVLREFGPLIAAIVTAARCSTGYAAMIGMMKVNLEVDALETMGRDYMTTLVLPRVFAMFIGLPLLTVAANIAGVLGNMFLMHIYLHVDFRAFLHNFSTVVDPAHYILGFQKVPFFAMLIATIGCYQGLMTPMNAEGIGRHTTVAAVQSIFWIIISDALFSVLSRMMIGY